MFALETTDPAEGIILRMGATGRRATTSAIGLGKASQNFRHAMQLLDGSLHIRIEPQGRSWLIRGLSAGNTIGCVIIDCHATGSVQGKRGRRSEQGRTEAAIDAGAKHDTLRKLEPFAFDGFQHTQGRGETRGHQFISLHGSADWGAV